MVTVNKLCHYPLKRTRGVGITPTWLPSFPFWSMPGWNQSSLDVSQTKAQGLNTLLLKLDGAAHSALVRKADPPAREER